MLRIRSYSMAKFSVGDILVAKTKERQRIDPLISLEQVTDVQNGQYFLTDYGAIDIEQAEKEYVSVNEVLWQHYILDTDTDKLTPFNGPMTIKEANELFKASKTNHTILLQAEWKGFWLPEEELDPKFYDDNILVHRDLIGEPLSERNLLTISSIDIPQKQYVFIDGSTKSISEIDEEYIEAFSEDTLWYFEFKLKDVGWITPADNKRMTFTEASFTSSIFLHYDDFKATAVLDRRILFSLGFQLKE